MTEFMHLPEEEAQALREIMPPVELLQELGDFYKVFSEPTRLKILFMLKNRELCVFDIAQLLEMHSSAISHQLRILKQMSLVRNRREGKSVYYSLADGHIETILSQGLDHIEE